MIINNKKILSFLKLQFFPVTVLLLLSTVSKASVPDSANMAKLAEQYNNENAIIANHTEKLVISYEDGELVAKSSVSEEKLLLNSLAASNDNWNAADHSYYHKLTGIHGLAYIPNNGTYKTSKNVDYSQVRPNEEVFYDDNLLTIQTFPGVTKGSVIQTTYNVWHTDLHIMPEFGFQENLPVKESKFIVVAPDYVVLKFDIQGENKNWIKQNTESINGNNVYTFTAMNIPAAKGFAGVPSATYYIPHIITRIVSYQLPGEETPKEVSSGVDKLYEFNYKFIRNLNIGQDSAITKLVKNLTKDESTAWGKASKIYQWVQSNIHYIAFEEGLEGFTPREASVVLARKYGDCKDITSILVAMFRSAGLTASYAWIGTTILPYKVSDFALPICFNHMICAFKINNEWKFADATHAGMPLGAYREDVQNKQALISIDAKNYVLTTMPELPAANNTVNQDIKVTMDGSQLSGKMIMLDSGFGAWNINAMLSNYKSSTQKDAELEKTIRRITEMGGDNFELANYNFYPTAEGERPVKIETIFNIPEQVKEFGGKLYVNLNLQHDLEGLYIDTTDRKAPYYFDYKRQKTTRVLLEIPDTISVSYLPKPFSASIPGLIAVNISYSMNGKNLEQTKQIVISDMMVKPGQFDAFNSLLDSMAIYYRDAVVLEPHARKAQKHTHKHQPAKHKK